MSIPEINIDEINIPPIPKYQIFEPEIKIVPKLVIDYPACIKIHRNNLVTEIDIDKNGTVIHCGLNVPSYEPLEYTPMYFNSTQSTLTNRAEQNPVIKTEQPQVPLKKKDKEFFIPCPDPNSTLRVGSWANEKKLEKVKAFEYNDDKTECLIIWEEVSFVETYIPTLSQFTGVFSLALVGCSAPFVLNLIKPLVKKVLTKLQKKGKKVK